MTKYHYQFEVGDLVTNTYDAPGDGPSTVTDRYRLNGREAYRLNNGDIWYGVSVLSEYRPRTHRIPVDETRTKVWLLYQEVAEPGAHSQLVLDNIFASEEGCRARFDELVARGTEPMDLETDTAWVKP